MATSEVELSNMALSAVGARATIISLTEDSTESNACALHFNSVRDALLQSAHWDFARKQRPLSLMRDATQLQPVPPPWVFEYAYPSDCLAGRFIIPSIQASTLTPPLTTAPVPAMPVWQGPAIKFIVGVDANASGQDVKVILTNQARAILVYTYRCTNPNMFDSLFNTAFIGGLEARFCIPVSGDKALAKLAIDEGRNALLLAQAKNGNEGLTVHDPQTDWINVRGIEPIGNGLDLYITPGVVYR